MPYTASLILKFCFNVDIISPNNNVYDYVCVYFRDIVISGFLLTEIDPSKS